MVWEMNVVQVTNVEEVIAFVRARAIRSDKCLGAGTVGA